MMLDVDVCEQAGISVYIRLSDGADVSRVGAFCRMCLHCTNTGDGGDRAHLV